jgi:probable F420-dependent oxidoreductase
MVITAQSPPVGELASAVEERGLDGLWLPDHTHVPTSQRTPYPLGGVLPERYKRVIDPLVGLALAVAATATIRVGTGILLAAQRDPITTAKALATLDCASGGRLAVGVGYGWNVEEMLDHGVEPTTRRARLREHVLAMRCLWENEIGEFAGEHVTVRPSWSWPKPVQLPLPVLIGGAPSAATLEHVAELAQGWIPLGERALVAGRPRLRDRAAALGRDPTEIEIVCFNGAMIDQAKMDRLESNGATEIAFDVRTEPPSRPLEALDRLAALVAARRSCGR